MTKRLIWADSLKGWLIILVILGHAIQNVPGIDCNKSHVWNLIYSFHMPAFMAVSGWLAFKGKISEPINDTYCAKYLHMFMRRSNQLLLPFVSWTIIVFIVKGNYKFQTFCEYLLYPDRTYWFLWVLFWICLLFNLAKLVAFKLRMNEMISVLGLCLLLFGIMVAMEIRILGFQFLAYYFLFYTLGYILHKYEGSEFLDGINKSLSLAVLTLLWAFLAWGWTMHGLPSWMPIISFIPSSLMQYTYRGFTALVAIIVLISVAPKILNGKDKMNQMICTLGFVSLGLYVVHLSLMSYIVDSILILMPSISTWTCVTIAFVVALVISCLVVWLLNKNKHTSRIFLGKI